MTALSSNEPCTAKDHQDIRFTLPSIMTIETVEQLAAEFKQWQFTEDFTLTLDASKVENITTPCIQLILSLEKAIAAQGGSFTINNRKGVFTYAFTDMGLENIIK